MTRSPVAIALVAATFALIILFQLLSHFGFPQLDYFHWKYDSFSGFSASHQTPILSQNIESRETDNGTQYLLGVGKADITGYSY